MPTTLTIAVAVTLAIGFCDAGLALAQTAPRGQATSPGQSRASNRLPQPPSGGIARGTSASGPESAEQRKARARAKRVTTICKGC